MRLCVRCWWIVAAVCEKMRPSIPENERSVLHLGQCARQNDMDCRDEDHTVIKHWHGDWAIWIKWFIIVARNESLEEYPHPRLPQQDNQRGISRESLLFRGETRGSVLRCRRHTVTWRVPAPAWLGNTARLATRAPATQMKSKVVFRPTGSD